MYSQAQLFKGGFAKTNITPDIGEPLNLIGGGTAKIESIGDPLYISAAVLTDGAHKIALISLDLIDLRAADFSLIKSSVLSLGFDHVVVSVTHTHGAYFSDSLLDRIHSEAIQTVKAAEEKLEPIKIGAGSTAVDEAYNRRVVKGNKVDMLWTNPKRIQTSKVDQSLDVIHIVKHDNTPFLTLFNYSAHPVITMDLNKAIISADYPGVLRNDFEKHVGGHSIFFLGAAGDVNPYFANTTPLENALEKSRNMGAKLSRAAQSVISSIKHYTEKGSFKFDTLTFNKPKAEISILLLTPDISISTFPGEYFNALGQEFKQQSNTSFTFFSGISNGNLRYIPTYKDALLGGYGADKNSFFVNKRTGESHIKAAVKRLNELVASQ